MNEKEKDWEKGKEEKKRIYSARVRQLWQTATPGEQSCNRMGERTVSTHRGNTLEKAREKNQNTGEGERERGSLNANTRCYCARFTRLTNSTYRQIQWKRDKREKKKRKSEDSIFDFAFLFPAKGENRKDDNDVVNHVQDAKWNVRTPFAWRDFDGLQHLARAPGATRDSIAIR